MFTQLNNLGNKIAHLFGDRIKFGVGDSYGKNSDLFNYAKLTSLLPYEAYDAATQLYFNKRSSGFILEALPLTSANEEMVNILASIVTDILPPNTDLQFLLWASSKIGVILDDFEQQRSNQGEVFEWLARKRTEFLKNGTHHSLINGENFNLRDFRLFIIVSLKIGRAHV